MGQAAGKHPAQKSNQGAEERHTEAIEVPGDVVECEHLAVGGNADFVEAGALHQQSNRLCVEIVQVLDLVFHPAAAEEASRPTIQ